MENEERRRKENALLKNISNVDERHERYPRPFEGKGYISTRNSRFRCLRCERDYNKHHFEIRRDTGKYNIEYLFVYVYYFISIHKENSQDLDILGQLIHGVRYLDIRLGHYPDNSEIWWTIHGPFYRSVPLKTVADHVKNFLDNTEEIVIMDIREFAVGNNSSFFSFDCSISTMIEIYEKQVSTIIPIISRWCPIWRRNFAITI